MFNRKIRSLVFVLFAALCLQVSVFSQAQADDGFDGAYLDPPYKGMIPLKSNPVRSADRPSTTSLPSRSDSAKLISLQTPVKSQASRGTCSIFSATAMLESMLVIKGHGTVADLDLSEEWLQYVNAAQYGGRGSTSTRNFSMIHEYGMPAETLMPYIGVEWESIDQSMQAQERCSKVPSYELSNCLSGHRDPRLLSVESTKLLEQGGEYYDPEFARARDSASELRAQYLEGVNESTYVGSSQEVKKLLSEGIPVTLDMDFYYGAWNHRLADKLEIGRDLDNWSKGIVGYPEYGSADYYNTRKEPAGHSILVVGYDDNRVVKTRVKMQDGTMKEFSYKGVYYFKNSWGTGMFGATFEIDGVSYPGYGMVTQKYAEEYGSFYRLSVK